MSWIDTVSLCENVGRRRRRRLFVVLATGWFALTAALVLEPCCKAFAAAPAGDHAAHADGHGEHTPTPCDPWFTQHIDLNGPAPAPLVEGPDIKTLAFAAAVAPGFAARPLAPGVPAHGPDPPRPLYLTLVRLLM